MSELDGSAARGAGGSAELAARARLEALCARIDRLIPDDLAHVGLAEGRGQARDAAREAAEDAVEGAGLGDLADAARDLARDRLIERWAAGLYRPTWAGALNWGVSTGRAEDRAEVVLALEDGALAAVAAGLVDDDVLTALGGDAEAILGMATGGPAEESLAAAVHVAAVARSPLAAAALVVVLVLLVVPTALLLGLGGGSVGAVGVGIGALVLAGGIAVVAVRRARRAAPGRPASR